MTIFESFIMSLFDIIGYIMISHGLLRKRPKNIKRIALYLLMFSFASIPVEKFVMKGYHIFFTMSFSLLFIYLFYRKSIMKTIYLWLITTVLLLCAQLISIMPLKIILTDIDYNFMNGLISQGISIVLVILIVYKLPLYILLEYIEKSNKLFKYLITNIFIILLFALIYWKLDIKNIFDNFIMFSVLSLIIVFINFVILRRGLKNEYESKQLQLYDKYFTVIEDLIKEVREKQHEFDNHIQALNMIALTSDDTEGISKYIKDYTQELSNKKISNLIKINNKILAGFLYSKQREAEDKGIRFNVSVYNYNLDTVLKDFELIEIVGNLIDNAFETNVKDNIVELIVKRDEKFNIIEVSNKYHYMSQKDISEFFIKEFSTKESKGRGYGLYNLREVLKKYDGEIEVLNKFREEYNSNFLVFRIIFR
ncbi:GHKL domain-containing protein [Clostridium sp. D2Q-14]|uniref:sensor histidine kinase n=1 Tax=Anaeromonas gelatinilytica TaxID=2683194 RepID=UPI00193C7A53|nr:GHKL domain-containing protein [Anaeromonas gelatinilytica]MBS4535132.1 GHKL domain-containing protein [Anaeromonas gelatinilytica]